MVVTQGGERRTVRPPRPGADQLEWPEVLPPYDVFDGEGRLVRRVELPEDRTIVGMGAATVYTVRTDEVGLQWLERYRR